MRRVPTIQDYERALGHPLRQVGGSRPSGRGVSPDLPLVSVVTIVRNGRDLLPGTVRSVLAQTYPNIEYVVVDGGSTDGTVDVLRRFDDRIDRWISEPDRGTSDAANKAISLARGRYIALFNCGDWFDPGFIDTAVACLGRSGADYAFGDLRTYRNETLVQVVKGDPNAMAPPAPDTARFAVPALVTRTSPTMVMKRACFERVGLFDLSYKVRNDFDWILRLHLSGGRGVYDSRLIGHFRLGGVSDIGSDFAHIFENLRILRRHGLLTSATAAPYLYRLIRYSTGHVAGRLLPDALRRTIKRAARLVFRWS